MTETRLLDYSMSHPTTVQTKQSGAVGVMRYLCHDSGAKRLTADEAKQLRAAGLWVGVVFEDAATRASAGMAAGHDDALFAEAQAGSIGVPTSCPIFFAVDQDTSPAAVADYFRGIAAAKISHPVGVYGSISVVDGILAAGLAVYGWQSAAWSGGQLSQHAHLYQRLTPTHPVSGTDENVLLRPLPLWGAPAPVAAQAEVQPQPVSHFTTLRRGSHGDVVAHLQRDLARVYPGIGVGPQGHYTDVTAAAVARLRHDTSKSPGDIGAGDFDAKAAHKLGWNV